MKLAKKETDLLGGRLTVRLPSKAKVQPRQASIMGAPAPSEDETRVVIDNEDQRLVIMAYEMYATGGSNFDGNVRALLGEGEGDYDIKRMELGDPGLYGVATIPTKLDRSSDAILLMGLYLANRDNTVQFLGFYVNETAAASYEEALGLVQSITGTIRPGKRSLEADGGLVRLRSVSPAVVEIELPSGYVTSQQTGPDFMVHSVRKLVPLGSPAPSLGVYFGFHPAYHHTREQKTFDTVEHALFGKKREWHRWSTQYGEQTTTMLEAMASLPGDPAPLAHVFLSADDPDTLAELQGIAKSLRVVADAPDD